ncbi:hypothetical protein [Nocardia sp. NPDC050710]|uniref:hypothetical protein n=1 Tax=Nocardia sp. NPDC050710 TaxID=3157220 RepID=UPI00340FB764
MTQRWRTASRVELVDGYSLIDREGRAVRTIDDVRVSIDGGFLHIELAAGGEVQVVSAPAVARVTYQQA